MLMKMYYQWLQRNKLSQPNRFTGANNKSRRLSFFLTVDHACDIVESMSLVFWTMVYRSVAVLIWNSSDMDLICLFCVDSAVGWFWESAAVGLPAGEAVGGINIKILKMYSVWPGAGKCTVVGVKRGAKWLPKLGCGGEWWWFWMNWCAITIGWWCSR